MKTKRHAMIIKIIASRDVETQEELAQLLGEQGSALRPHATDIFHVQLLYHLDLSLLQ